MFVGISGRMAVGVAVVHNKRTRSSGTPFRGKKKILQNITTPLVIQQKWR